MSYLDWEKKKYAGALKLILERREVLVEKLKDIADEFSMQSRGEPFFGVSAETKKELDQAIAAAVTPPFKVVVQPLQASNGLSYFVTLLRTDTPRVPTLRHEGRITPINRHSLEEANAEGFAWAAFLGVEFTPCEPVADTANKNTVPQYGTRHVPDIMKMMVEYKDAVIKASHLGGEENALHAQRLYYELEHTIAELSMEGKPYTEEVK